MSQRALAKKTAPPPAPAPEAPPLRSINSVRAAEPTGRERTFAHDTLLVTKTDLNGRITYANKAFLDIAGYDESALVGQAHSVIRHPDMPRCVFKLLWSTIQSGKEIFAYVVNLCREGDHYWVFAHVTPTFDNNGSVIGYHSNRRAPDREQIARIKVIYDKLNAVERNHDKKADAIAASTALLNQMLAEQNKTYDEFVFSI